MKFYANSLFLTLLFGACNTYKISSIKFPDEFPEAIDGCSCIYAEYNYKLELGEFIWVDNMDSTGFCKLSDSVYQFQLLEGNEDFSLWENELFRAEIHVDLREQKEFTYKTRGTLEITTLKGRSIFSGHVVGECGC